MDRLPAVASIAAEGRSSGGNIPNQLVLVAYFRGQLLVCLVDGILIGTLLTLVGLNFAPVIGAMVVVLTMIPYIGIIICWVPLFSSLRSNGVIGLIRSS